MKKILTALAVLAMVAGAQAAVIANYTFTGSSPADSAAYENMTAGNIAMSSGTMLYSTAGATGWTAAGGEVPVGDFGSGWNTSAQDLARAFQFTITPNSGFEITISGLDFLY